MNNIKGKDALVLSTNICYVLADVMEVNLIELESIFRKNNRALRHEQKRLFNTAISSVKKLRGEVFKCKASTQENFGNDADMLNAMILTLIDRCGDDDMLMYKFYEYIKSFPSRLGFVEDMDIYFSHIFQRKNESK